MSVSSRSRCVSFGALLLAATWSATFASATAKEVQIGGVPIVLTAPAGYCELKDSESVDRELLEYLSESNRGQNSVLGAYADCSQLNLLRRGETGFLNDFALYMSPTIAEDVMAAPRHLAQLCETMRADGTGSDAELALRVNKRLKDVVEGIKVGELQSLGVVDEDSVGCYSAQVSKYSVEGLGDAPTLLAISASTIVQQKLLNYYLYGPYGDTALPTMLAQHKENVAAVRAANPTVGGMERTTRATEVMEGVLEKGLGGALVGGVLGLGAVMVAGLIGLLKRVSSGGGTSGTHDFKPGDRVGLYPSVGGVLRRYAGTVERVDSRWCYVMLDGSKTVRKFRPDNLMRGEAAEEGEKASAEQEAKPDTGNPQVATYHEAVLSYHQTAVQRADENFAKTWPFDPEWIGLLSVASELDRIHGNAEKMDAISRVVVDVFHEGRPVAYCAAVLQAMHVTNQRELERLTHSGLYVPKGTA